MPRYVLLRHELFPNSGRSSHWDFMLEHEGVLWTWALDGLPSAWSEQLCLPCSDTSDVVPARRLPDHRSAYLDYEGPVSEDRGHVTRTAEGEYTSVAQRPDRIEIQLTGALNGIASLSQKNDTPDYWQLKSLRPS